LILIIKKNRNTFKNKKPSIYNSFQQDLFLQINDPACLQKKGKYVSMGILKKINA